MMRSLIDIVINNLNCAYYRICRCEDKERYANKNAHSNNLNGMFSFVVNKNLLKNKVYATLFSSNIVMILD